MGENKGKAKENWGRRGRGQCPIKKGTDQLQQKWKGSWYKVVTDYKNHDIKETQEAPQQAPTTKEEEGELSRLKMRHEKTAVVS